MESNPQKGFIFLICQGGFNKNCYSVKWETSRKEWKSRKKKKKKIGL